MMDQERTAALLAKYIAGELTPGEKEELEWAFLANPGLRDTVRVLQGLSGGPVPGMGTEEERRMLERGLSRFRAPAPDGSRIHPVRKSIHGSVEPIGAEGVAIDAAAMDAATISIAGEGNSNVRPIRPLRWIAAASIVVLLGIGAAIYLRPVQRPAPLAARPAPSAKEITTKYGTRSYLELPDGSKIWLNAGTTVSYADGFTADKRELTLSGEAYFDIRKDPSRPFIVHVGKLDIRVLGTSFNVKAYPGEPAMEATLINGKIEIGLAGHQGGGVVLQPSDKVTIPLPSVTAKQADDSMVVLSKKAVRPDSVYRTIIETSWVEDKLVFRSESFASVAGKLERWYNIKIRIENDKYLPMALTGYFKEQPVENVMNALSLSLGFRYRIEGGVIRIF